MHPRQQFETLTEKQIQSVLRELRKALKKMRGIVRGDRGTEFDRFAALRKKQAIEREVDALERTLVNRIGDATRAAVPIADDLHPEAPANGVGISANVVSRAQADAAKFVRDITDRARRELNQAVVQATTGEDTRQEFEQRIADVIDEDVMSSRVERIARTELGKVFEDQGRQADQELAAMGSDLIKVWSHKCGGAMCPGARPDHVALHGQERELWQDFNVGGGATKSTPPGGVGTSAPRPLDGALPAKHVINCGCTVERIPRVEAVQPYTAKVNPRAQQTQRVAASRR